MNNDFEESIVLLQDKFAANRFWYANILDIIRFPEKRLVYESEIIQLYQPFKSILRRYPFEDHRRVRFLNLKDRWDSEDGNPIFYGYLPHLQKAVRIVQSPPQDSSNQLGAWVEKSFTDFRMENTYFLAREPQELVVYIELNAITFHYAMLLIYFWISHRNIGENLEERLIKIVYGTKINDGNPVD